MYQKRREKKRKTCGKKHLRMSEAFRQQPRQNSKKKDSEVLKSP